MASKSAPRPDTRFYDRASAVLPSVWWVGRGSWGQVPALGGQSGCNVWLLKGRAFDVLVDSGMDADTKKLEACLRAAGHDPRRIREIWITHSHTDHIIGAVAWTKKYPRLRVRVPRMCYDYLKRGNYRLVGCGYDGNRSAFRAPARMTPFDPGAALACPPFRFKVVPLPGHIPDHVGFRARMHGLDVLFTGDAIIGDQGKAKGVVGWLDGFWLSNLRTYIQTMETIRKNPPDLFLAGHGVPHFGPSARRSIRNCELRLKQMAKIKALGTMVPFA
ncbi:MAG: MBL fold metallo-hydrolase [Planctomycetes bacterium]|nr:MBL fold metallo-hydrolase [Planctomycetota bacterium]